MDCRWQSPDGDGGGFRTHVWFAPDPRIHNHPQRRIWCKVARGWYVAKEYTLLGDGQVHIETVTLRAGDPERCVDHDTFHQVVEILPGTVSVMTFDRLAGDARDWGYLVPPSDTSVGWWTEPNGNDVAFLDALRHLNPHMRPAGWDDPYAAMPIPDVREMMTALGL